MVPVILSLDGRSAAAHVAMLLAQAFAASGLPTTRIRLAYIGEPTPFGRTDIDHSVPFVQLAAHPATASVDLDRALTRCISQGRRAVLDLPIAFLMDPSLGNRPDVVRVIPVGPSPLDIAIARETLRGFRVHSGERLPILLPTGRAGETLAARQLARAMSADDHADRFPILPATLPVLSPGDMAAIVAGRPTRWCLQRAAVILDALLRVPVGEQSPTEEAPERSRASGGCSGLASKLHALAYDIEAFGDGRFPTEEELAVAPVLENWLSSGRVVPALVGNIFGHPSVQDGRLSRTSELFFTDGSRFARTHSRLYRLGRPAAPTGRRIDVPGIGAPKAGRA